MTRAVLFDLDGTLADTADDLAAAVNRLLQEERRPEKPAAALRRQASRGAQAMVRAGFGNSIADDEFERLVSRFLVIYAAHLHDRTRLFPAVAQTLQTLRAGGVRWGVVTNKNRHLAEPLLRYLGILDTADCLVYGDTTSQKKPSPEPLLFVARELGLATRDCVYVGDDLRDIEAARAAKMPVLAAAWGYRPAEEDITQWNADGVLNSVGELIPWLDTRTGHVGRAN